MLASARSVLLLVCCALCSSLALDMKWTPNGEGPAPFSKNAREEMGMDPAAMAGQPAAAQGGGTLGMGLGALLVVYFTNNWNVVLALQGVLQRLLGPLLVMQASKTAARAQTTDVAAAKQARAARLKRLAADSK
tara:strand:- start:31 stop:432 length:402 start_codon:yes stop_codon:yes gene_type:complete